MKVLQLRGICSYTVKGGFRGMDEHPGLRVSPTGLGCSSINRLKPWSDFSAYPDTEYRVLADADS